MYMCIRWYSNGSGPPAVNYGTANEIITTIVTRLQFEDCLEVYEIDDTGMRLVSSSVRALPPTGGVMLIDKALRKAIALIQAQEGHEAKVRQWHISGSRRKAIIVEVLVECGGAEFPVWVLLNLEHETVASTWI